MRRSARRSSLAWTVPIVLLAACGEPADPTPTPAGRTPVAPRRHDFGVLRHGAIAVQDIPLSEFGEHAGFFVRGFSAGCPLCASGSLFLERRDGSRTPLASGGAITPEWTIQPDQRVVVSLRIDTNAKEAQDMPPLETRAFAVLRGPPPAERDLELPLLFTFAIDAPIEVLPFPHVPMGQLARGAKFTQTLTLRGDAKHPNIRFGPVRTSEPALQATLRQEEGETLLDVAYEIPPERYDGPLPPLSIGVGTDLAEPYELHLPVSGAVLPRFVVEPPYGVRFDRAERGRESTGYANVLDHDPGSGSGLAVLRVRDREGQDLSEHFEVRIEPVPGMTRTLRVHMRYLGTMEQSFFGAVDLCRPGKTSPLASVEFRGLQR